jgi:hypothetical protein
VYTATGQKAKPKVHMSMETTDTGRKSTTPEAIRQAEHVLNHYAQSGSHPSASKLLGPHGNTRMAVTTDIGPGERNGPLCSIDN